MDFLKALFNDKALTFEEFTQAINAHNGNEANKESQIKLANLGTGEYVGKGKYDAEVLASQGKDTEIANYKKAIEDLQKANKGNEDIQNRIAQLETENAQLKADQEASDRKYAFDILLMDAGVADKDEREFLAYKYEKKLKEEGKTLELDDNKHIKGGDAIVESLKTTNPKPFESSGSGKMKVLGDNRLPEGDGERITEPQSLAEALKMQYENK